MTDENRSGHERRAHEVSHSEILEKLEYMSTSFEEYRAEWDPMLPMMKDVAAVGRVGKICGKVIIYGGMIAAALTAIIASIKAGVPFK